MVSVQTLCVSTLVALLALSGDLALAQNPPDDGNGSRLEVNARAYPWSPIGRLNAGGRGHCTGFMIGEDKLLTAAHCLYDSVTGRWRGAGELHFVGAYQRENYSLHSPVESYQISEEFQPKQAAVPENAASDWAIVTLKESLGQRTGWYGLRRLDEELTRRIGEGKAVMLQAGYQRRRAHVITATFSCDLLGRFAKNAGIAHGCPVDKGDSGSPLLVLDRGRISAVGIHVFQLRLENKPIAGVLSLDSFDPEATSPATRDAAEALKGHWGPGRRPEDRDNGGSVETRVASLPLKAIDSLLHQSGLLPAPAALDNGQRETAIKAFQGEQKVTRDGKASLQLLERLLRVNQAQKQTKN